MLDRFSILLIFYSTRNTLSGEGSINCKEQKEKKAMNRIWKCKTQNLKTTAWTTKKLKCWTSTSTSQNIYPQHLWPEVTTNTAAKSSLWAKIRSAWCPRCWMPSLLGRCRLQTAIAAITGSISLCITSRFWPAMKCQNPQRSWHVFFDSWLSSHSSSLISGPQI